MASGGSLGTESAVWILVESAPYWCTSRDRTTALPGHVSTAPFPSGPVDVAALASPTTRTALTQEARPHTTARARETTSTCCPRDTPARSLCTQNARLDPA